MILDYFNVRKLVVVATVAWVGSFQLWGQSVIRTSSTEKAVWQQSKDRLKSTAEVSPIFSITGNEKGTEWKAWGTTFNELDWDALLMLTRDEQEEIMYNLFAPQGDLKFTRGRISMNCKIMAVHGIAVMKCKVTWNYAILTLNATSVVSSL